MSVTTTRGEIVHGTDRDPEFRGEDMNHAIAHDCALEAELWLRERLTASERFAPDGVRFEGEIVRQRELVEDFVRRSLGETDAGRGHEDAPDYVGMSCADADSVPTRTIDPGD